MAEQEKPTEESMECVEIHDPDNPGEKKTIPKADYDPAVHTLWSEPMPEQQHMDADDAGHDPDAPVYDPDHEPVPGPPMQNPIVTMSPEALPEQPNAAVIEAPGSKAAEIVHRHRGDEPVDLPGPRQDRSEPETRRAEDMQRSLGGEGKQTEEDRLLRREEMSSDQGEHHEMKGDEKPDDSK